MATTEPTLIERYSGKDRAYFGTARLDMLALLRRGECERLLELGAGDGATLRAAKDLGLATHTVGIDAVGPFAGEAARGVDRFERGDIESMSLDLFGAPFDAVLCADVLEHLVDPWAVVNRLVELLRPGGLFLASLPNFRNHRALRPIVCNGDLAYANAGLLDRTHLRFFCRRNAIQLLEQAGLTIETVAENMGAYGLRHRALDWLTLGTCHEFFVHQYRLRARKPL
jgi:2-polyprenyl-3-methyl-5-hydroxy-6-metoxy-1,4-benzoquinol methylase